MADLAKLRALWPQVARRLVGEGWTEADLLEARGLLAEAAQKRDSEALAGWLVWMEQHLARPERCCLACAGRCQPKGTDGFCGGGRGDLPFAFSAGHPLRRLPADGGVKCELWRAV